MRMTMVLMVVMATLRKRTVCLRQVQLEFDNENKSNRPTTHKQTDFQSMYRSLGYAIYSGARR